MEILRYVYQVALYPRLIDCYKFVTINKIYIFLKVADSILTNSSQPTTSSLPIYVMSASTTNDKIV